MADTDPFRHHPGLRGRITPPEDSFFRDFSTAKLEAMLAEKGLATGWWRSDAEREANRRDTLAIRPTPDLWVFAYGSLMWNPAFLFAEVRHGRVDGYARSFCLYDTRGGRGTKEQPGLMAALDKGEHCHGLVFRIAADLVEAESRILFKREMLMGSYVPGFVSCETGLGAVEALTFVANHAAPHIRTDIPHADKVRYIATGTGRLGSSREYLENLADQFEALDIDDPEVFGLLKDVRAFSGTAD